MSLEERIELVLRRWFFAVDEVVDIKYIDLSKELAKEVRRTHIGLAVKENQ